MYCWMTKIQCEEQTTWDAGIAYTVACAHNISVSTTASFKTSFVTTPRRFCRHNRNLLRTNASAEQTHGKLSPQKGSVNTSEAGGTCLAREAFEKFVRAKGRSATSENFRGSSMTCDVSKARKSFARIYQILEIILRRSYRSNLRGSCFSKNTRTTISLASFVASQSETRDTKMLQSNYCSPHRAPFNSDNNNGKAAIWNVC